MRDRPTGAELLAEARRTMLDLLVPLLPPERRYDGLMVANAMAITARELDGGPATLRARAEALSALLGRSATSTELDEALLQLERQLVQQIRDGLYDLPGGSRDAVRQYLRDATVARLRLSNPKALEEEG